MRVATRLSFLFRRASVLSGPEIAYRLRRLVGDASRRAGGAIGIRGHPGIAAADHRFVRSADAQLFVPPLERSAASERRLLDGDVPVYGSWIPWRDAPEFWHTDHLFGRVWPMQPTGRIGYRPGNPIGDVRIVWELNRLQHLVVLGSIVAGGGEKGSRAAHLVDAQLRSWTSANPRGTGVNHASAMEQALRIVSVTHAFDLARPLLPASSRRLVAELVLTHAADVERRLSLFSSAGNHTIAECVGLLYAGTLFPEHPRADRWARTGRELLRTEGARQVNADGGGMEQATWYLLFVADLLGLAQALLAHRAQRPIPELDGAVARARDFLGCFGSGARDLPAIGDGDGGYALSPDLRISWGRPAPGAIARELPHTGLTVVAPSAQERLVVLHNPLGMPPSCGHGHADCLSVLFRRGGVDLLIDPGTYLYGGPPALRAYFRSTPAHNTATVGGRDQAEQIAPFMWKGSYRCQVLLRRSDGGRHLVLARHDAYRRRGVTHWRGVAYQEEAFLAIWDFLEGSRGAGFALHWHLGCPARLEGAGREVVLAPPGSSPLLMSLPPGEAALFAGSEAPLLGWRSTDYGRREPCPTIRWRPSQDRRPEAVTTLWLTQGEHPRQEVDDALRELRAAAGFGRVAAGEDRSRTGRS